MVATLVFFLLREYLSQMGGSYLIILGALAIVVMLFLPGGLWGTLAVRFKISLFPTQRRIVDEEPAKPEDTRNMQASALD